MNYGCAARTAHVMCETDLGAFYLPFAGFASKLKRYFNSLLYTRCSDRMTACL
jgi:hypothetical protein